MVIADLQSQTSLSLVVALVSQSQVPCFCEVSAGADPGRSSGLDEPPSETKKFFEAVLVV